MSYQVLARKWRPRSFSTLVGQEHVVRALTHALDQQRLHHAYLFTGTRGVGKTTIARIMAKALNCETGVTATPCGQCSSCQEIDGGRFIDYIELDAASNRGVDDMTQLLERATYAPTRGRYKVYVIDEVHQLSGHAFNAMLKTLEEPPEHVKFILATTDPQKIPVTVLSRCLQFNLKQMPQVHIVDHLTRVLEAEGVPFDAAALRPLAKGASGSMRDALSLLDQAIAHGAGEVREEGVHAMLGSVGTDHLIAILDALRAGEANALVATAQLLEARNLSFSTALQDLATLFHRVALLQLAPQAVIDSGERESLAPFAQAFDPEYLQLCYQIAIHGRDELELAPDEFSGFVMSLLRLHAFAPGRAGNSGAPSASPARGVGRVGSAGKPESLAGVASAGHAADATSQRTTAPSHAAQSRVAGSSPTSSSGASAVPSAGADTDWHTLAARMNLAGMAKQLALHCALVRQTENEIKLNLAPAHKHLLGKLQEDKVREELGRIFGTKVLVTIAIAETAGDSPMARTRNAARARQDQAIAAIEQDPVVQDIVERFDASIDESSIRPL